ncbi:3-hydroxyisobutyrate dehydrogenase-like beta-hydroxyacid dehydrogenase [Luteimonas cucumeris]|uniref:3-hydroxyisobutyrate dehydrogenase-like beta-hydroxyacid dehydrogenase n=1 Tax=Luteimonas cucumeris TaxID=985012 RepID=A0A562LDX1_9GAMM|nr:NAD(P)-binding domain-containing protein [Luteimonas cucumeris]TWI05843.1 3-hydroxyisobutyrate dehydrogenase-like beta-hydroxyacid dehydrogenase [Luteimonas cucumeris]
MAQQREISVIGLGDMGGVLARTLLHKGWRVTVWNRGAARAQALAVAGATRVDDPAEALAASPIAIICLSNYAAMREVLDRGGEALRGRVIVQLGNGTPQDARDAATWIASRGAAYLDGTILAWPSQIGGEETVILVSGAEDAFARARPALQALGGGTAYTGTRIEEAAALAAAALAYLAGHWIGMAHASLLCRSEGLDVQALAGMLADFAPVLADDLRHMGRVIGEGRYANPESTLRTAGTDIANLVRQAHEAGIGDEFPAYVAGLFRRAVAAGHGDEEHVAVIKVLGNAA